MSNTSLLSRPELSSDTINLILSYCKLGDLLFISLVDKGTSKIVQEKLTKNKDKTIDKSNDISLSLYMVIYRLAYLNRYDILYAFISQCEYGYLEHAKLIYLKSSNLKFTYDNALIKACKNGYLQVAQWLESIGANLEDNQYKLYDDACKNDQIEIFKWLDTKKGLVPNYNDALNIACKAGSIEIVKYLISKNVSVTKSHITNVIIYSYIDILKLLLPLNSCNKEKLYYSACANSSLEIVEFLYLPEYNHTKAFGLACGNNKLNISKWLYAKNTDIDLSNLTIIQYYYDKELKDWLQRVNIPYATHVITFESSDDSDYDD